MSTTPPVPDRPSVPTQDAFDDDPERHLPAHHSPLPELTDEHVVHPSSAAFQSVQASREFGELRNRFRRFSFPLTIAFLVWYFAYVLLSTYAVDFMTTKVMGNVTVGLILGLLQFVTTFAITWLYIRHANKNLDPIASKLRAEVEGGVR